MPSKPDIKYKTLEIPAGLISIANELAEICLKTKQEEQITLLTMQNVLELFIKSYPEYVQYEYINNASDISNITIAGFTIYCNGDIDFNLKNIVSEKWFHIFNIDFYGFVDTEQLLEFLDSLKNDKQDLEDVKKWIKYKSYEAPSRR